MSKRLFGIDAIAYARAQEADDILVRGEDGEWRFASLSDAMDAQDRADEEGASPAPCVVMIDVVE